MLLSFNRSNRNSDNTNTNTTSNSTTPSHSKTLASQEPRLSFTETSVDSIPEVCNIKITLDRSIQKELKKKPKERSFGKRFFGTSKEELPALSDHPPQSPPTTRTASTSSVEHDAEAVFLSTKTKRVSFAATAKCVGKARKPSKGYNPWYDLEDFRALSQSAQWMAGVLQLEDTDTRPNDPRARVHLLQKLHHTSLTSTCNTHEDDYYSNRLSLMTTAEMSEYRSLYDTHSDLPDTTLLGMEGCLCPDFQMAKSVRRRQQLETVRQIQALAAQVGTPPETVVAVMARECTKISHPGRVMARHLALALARCKEVRYY